MIRTVALIVLYGVSLLSYASPPVNKPGGPPWPSGVGQIMTPDGIDAWQQWMGYDVDVVVAMTPATTWATFRTGKGDSGSYFKAALADLPKTTTIIYSYPMLPNEVSNKGCKNPGVWDQFAAGQFDSHYREMARNMRSLIQAEWARPFDRDYSVGLGNEWRMVPRARFATRYRSSSKAGNARSGSFVKRCRECSSISRLLVRTPASQLATTTVAALALTSQVSCRLTTRMTIISLSTHDGGPFTTSDAVFEIAFSIHRQAAEPSA